MKFIKVFIEWESVWRTATLQHCNTDAANGHIPRHTPVSPTAGGTGETGEGDCEEGKEWPCREREL